MSYVSEYRYTEFSVFAYYYMPKYTRGLICKSIDITQEFHKIVSKRKYIKMNYLDIRNNL